MAREMDERDYTNGSDVAEQEALTITRLRAELEAARAETEVERMRLAACGVVALSNTPDSAAKAREILPEYRSGSLEDVIRAVDSEMALRTQLEAAKAEIERKMSAGQFVLEQLAAEQAKNAGLRALLQNLVDSSVICCAHFKTDHDAAIQGLQDTLSDTSALEAIVKKAGEVMRERIRIAEEQGWLNKELIRTLPAVTLDDLKGGK